MVESDPRMRVAEIPAAPEGEEQQLQFVDWNSMDPEDLIHKLERTVNGYDDYENCFERHFAQTIEGIHKLTVKIQQQSLFSANETLSEVVTEHLKMLMVPYLEAEVLFRTMTDRAASVRKAHTYYLEYLKLMNHYNLLEKPVQVKAYKELAKQHRMRTNPGVVDDDEEEEQKSNKEHPMVALSRQMEDRDTKIANFRLKKALEANIDKLRNYENDEMKRDFYLMQLKLSVLKTFEQLRLSDMEIDMHVYASNLSCQQVADNQERSKMIAREDLPPLSVTHIGPEDVKGKPYLLETSGQGQARAQQESNVVSEYIDPMRQYKPIDRINVRNEDINDRMTLKQQYQQQVFQPGHNLPTMSLNELADMEMADAIERQEKDKVQEAERANEDPDDECILEAQRIKDSRMDDWKDYVPKGRGNTKRM